jgi:hypothetical protein
MAADERFLRAVDGTHRDCPAENWFEGTDNDASTGREFNVPAGALVAKIFSSVAAYYGPVAEASLDISGDGFNAGYIPAGQWSNQLLVAGRAKISVKAASGNLAIVSVQWGGKE